MANETDLRQDTPGSGRRTLAIELAIAAAMLLAAALVYPHDAELSQAISGSETLKSLSRTPAARAVRMLGKFDVVWFFMLFACWATGNRRMLWRFGWASAVSGLFVLAVKHAVGRQRPSLADELSFPSGDSLIAFVGATIVAAEYTWLAVPAFLTAAFVAAMRVVGGRHFPSDVIVGSLIGMATARMAVRWLSTVPPRLFRLTRRTGKGLALPAAFVVYIALRTAFEKKWTLLLAAFVVPAVLAAVLIARRKAYARWLRMARAESARRRSGG